MNRRGTLGDSSTTEESRRSTRSNVAATQTLSSNRNGNGPSTSKAARERIEFQQTQMVARKSTSRRQELLSVPARGAARRKQKTYQQRHIQMMRQMIKLQNSTALQIPRAPFARVVREISMGANPDITHYTPQALEALHEATEMFITQVLQDAYMLTLHRQCVTLAQKDMVLLRALKLQM